MNKVIELSNGNPGAMNCLMGLDAIDYNAIVPFLEENNIVGTDIYILWSDLANKDNAKMRYLVENCPANIVKDAASRQDYSGRQFVKPYLDEKEKAIKKT